MILEKKKLVFIFNKSWSRNFANFNPYANNEFKWYNMVQNLYAQVSTLFCGRSPILCVKHSSGEVILVPRYEYFTHSTKIRVLPGRSFKVSYDSHAFTRKLPWNYSSHEELVFQIQIRQTALSFMSLK